MVLPASAVGADFARKFGIDPDPEMPASKGTRRRENCHRGPGRRGVPRELIQRVAPRETARLRLPGPAGGRPAIRRDGGPADRSEGLLSRAPDPTRTQRVDEGPDSLVTATGCTWSGTRSSPSPRLVKIQNPSGGLEHSVKVREVIRRLRNPGHKPSERPHRQAGSHMTTPTTSG